MATKKKTESKAAFSPEKVKHLDFIQDGITRMNTYSFHIKGAAVTFISASLLSATQNRLFALGAIPPLMIFWFLDAYYLWQERKFRGLYQDVAGISEKPKDIKLFAIRPDLYTGGKYAYWDVFTSITIILLYLPVILFLLGIYFFI